MAWARISDDFLDHPKVAELTVDIEGLAALGLWTSALCWVRADRRRAGLVPPGIAVRFSAGAGKKLADRLVSVGLWEAVDGGYRFHDFEDVYTPGDLSEKRAQAGRAGGKASGRTRAGQASAKVQAEPTKQLASSKIGSNRAVGGSGDASLFDDDDPLISGSARSPKRSNREANPKQLASKPEAKRGEASHTRAGATTHYPEASNEASSSAPPASTNGESDEQRVNRLTRTYTDVVKLSNFPAIRSIVKKAVGSGDYTEDQITAGLAALAHDRDTVSTNTLRFAIEGLPKRMTDRHINAPYQAQRVNRDEPGSHTAAWDRRRAAHAQQ